jgi:hypothetical protein
MPTKTPLEENRLQGRLKEEYSGVDQAPELTDDEAGTGEMCVSAVEYTIQFSCQKTICDKKR